MTFALRKHVPGRADINRAFSREHLAQMKADYAKLQQSGGYHFGDLSALFCGLDKQEREYWDQEIASFYSPDVQQEIARTIQAALFHKDKSGLESPIPLRFDWPSGTEAISKGIRVTYNPVGPSYHIELIGYPSPAGSALARRRKEKELTPDDDIEG